MTDILTRLVRGLLGSVPDDGPREQDRYLYRLLMAIGAVLIPVFGMVHYWELTGSTSIVWSWLEITALFVGVLGGSYVSGWVERHLGHLYRGLIWVTLLWFSTLMVMNQLAPSYVIGIFWLLGVLSIAYGVGIQRETPLRAFFVLAPLLIIGGISLTPDPATSPLFVGIGVVGIAAVFYPIARSRVQTEARLRESREEYRSLAREADAVFREGHDPAFLVDVKYDPDGAPWFEFIRINVNEEDLLGLGSNEERGITPRELLGEETGAEVAERYRRCVEAAEVVEYEETLPAPDGERIWHTKLTPIIIDGTVHEIVGIARDITKAKRRERQLLLLDQMIQHDLRSDIAKIRSWADLIGDDGVPTADAVDVIDTAGARLSDTLDTVREVQRALQSGSEMEVESVALVPMVKEAVQSVRQRTSGASIGFYSQVPDSACVRGNALLVSVFENLVSNGIRHNDQTAPEVTVTVTGETDQIRVTVADNGPGIPPDDRDRIFERGESGAGSPGLGLGLFLVRTLVNQYSGSVDVKDNAPRGTRFIVALPRTDAAEESAPLQGSARAVV